MRRLLWRRRVARLRRRGRGVRPEERRRLQRWRGRPGQQRLPHCGRRRRGGRFGGGGGGAGSVIEDSRFGPGGGGGGGGSNLLPAGATAALETDGKPGITISYTDLAAPLVSLDQPPAASQNAVPVLTGAGGTQLGDGNVSVRVYAGSSTGGTLVQTLTATPDAATGRYSVAPSPALADGTYTAVASQSDAAGNASTSLLPRTFRIDTTAPAVSLTAPASTADTTPTLTGTAEPRAVTVNVYAGAGATGVPIRTLTTTPNAAGAYSVTVNTVLLIPLLPGTYTARASQTDAVGNFGSSAARTFTVDVTAPSVSLTAPSAQVADTTPRFSGVGGIAAGDSATVTVRVYAGAAATGTPLQTLNASRSATTGAYAVDASTALAQGQYTAVASQSDAAGNGGKSAARTFIVDTIAPVVTLTTAESYIAVPNVPQFRGVGGRVAGDSSTVTVRVYAGTSATGTPVNTASAGRNSQDGRYFAQGLPLVTGTYTAVTSQSDAAGNVGKSTSRTFSINGIL
jgi:hypothetical protein